MRVLSGPRFDRQRLRRADRRAGQETRNVEQQRGIPHVVHRRVGRFRQYLAIPVHRLRERRWGLPHPVRDPAVPGWEAVLLPRDDHRTVLQQVVRERLGHVAGFRW